MTEIDLMPFVWPERGVDELAVRREPSPRHSTALPGGLDYTMRCYLGISASTQPNIAEHLHAQTSTIEFLDYRVRRLLGIAPPAPVSSSAPAASSAPVSNTTSDVSPAVFIRFRSHTSSHDRLLVRAEAAVLPVLRDNEWLTAAIRRATNEALKQFGSEASLELRYHVDPVDELDQRLFLVIRTKLELEEAFKKYDLLVDWWAELDDQTRSLLSVSIEPAE